MKIIQGIEALGIKDEFPFVAVGIFDGVHRGHQRILSEVIKDARRFKKRSLVMTFNPHPSCVLSRRTARPLLISLEHRLRLFEELGLDACLVVKFSRSFSRIPREKFVENILLKKLKIGQIYVGSDFRFGRGALGDVTYLKKMGKVKRFRVHEVKPIRLRNQIVSSTRLRQLIEKGALNEAHRMLGRYVSLFGEVVPGDKRGRRLGYRTANVDHQHEVVPPYGVYAAIAALGDERYDSVVNVGFRPTFNGLNFRSQCPEPVVEVHFLNFKRNIYHREVELFFIGRIRDEVRFFSPKELKHQIGKDIQKAKNILQKTHRLRLSAYVRHRPFQPEADPSFGGGEMSP